MNNQIAFHDTTFRDGSQSLWAMKMKHGAYDAVAEELDEAGFHRIEIPTNALAMKMMVRTLKEDPYETFKIFKNKITKSRKTFGTGAFIDMMVPNVSRDMLDLYHRVLHKHAELTDCWSIVATKDEVTRDLPIVVPSVRKYGLKWSPAIAYTVSPRHTDAFFAKVVRDCLKYHPETIMLKDAGGLLTPERVKTLVPAMRKEAPHLPFEIHSHGMSTFEPAVLAECMKLGVDIFHTCVRPLAFGSSHCAIDTAVKNAEVLGLSHQINLETFINITSVAGLTGLGSSIAYAATKAAANSITKSLARAMAPEVRVNSLAPGIVETDWYLNSGYDLQQFTDDIPMGRTATPEEIAEFAYALIEHSPYITGEVIKVDGGMFIS